MKIFFRKLGALPVLPFIITIYFIVYLFRSIEWSLEKVDGYLKWAGRQWGME